MQKDSKIYLSAFGKKTMAGPVIVVAVVFFSSLDSYYNLELNLKLRQSDYEQTENFLLRLPRESYYLKYQIIPSINIERFSYGKCVSKAVDILGSKLKYELKLNRSEFWLSSNEEVMGSIYSEYYREDKSTLESYWADTYCKYIQMNQMRVLHLLNSNYNWNTNYGHNDFRHLSKILYYGPDLRLHRTTTLTNLARHWLTLIEDNDYWSLCQPWLNTPPEWWTQLFPDRTFTYNLSITEIKQLHKSMTRISSRRFRLWLRKEGKSIGFSSELIDLSCGVELDVPQHNPAGKLQTLVLTQPPIYVSQQNLQNQRIP